MSVLAWLHDDEFAGAVRKAMDWIVTRCKAGRFGSTQATVLALKAIVAYDIATARPKSSGTLSLALDGVVIDTQTFTAASEGVITFQINSQACTMHCIIAHHAVLLHCSGCSREPCCASESSAHFAAICCSAVAQQHRARLQAYIEPSHRLRHTRCVHVVRVSS